jgi:uncharacterized protein YjiS (DUF1127 family)
MTYVDTRYMTATAAPTWLRSGADILRRLLHTMQRSVEISRRRRVLHQMPDYLLKDIGISRSEIDYVAVVLADERADPTRRPRGAAVR